MLYKIGKKLFGFYIIASELDALICLYEEEKTWDRQSICSQTVQEFSILLRETFPTQLLSRWSTNMLKVL